MLLARMGSCMVELGEPLAGLSSAGAMADEVRWATKTRLSVMQTRQLPACATQVYEYEVCQREPRAVWHGARNGVSGRQVPV